MTKRLTVVPQGGLCNRLRVALSALSAFPDCEVEWGSDKACYAYFDELFQPLKGVVRRRWWNVPQTRRNLHIPALLRRWIYDAQLVNACSAIVFNFAGNITDLMPLPLKTPRMVVVAFSGVRSIVLRAVQFSKQ